MEYYDRAMDYKHPVISESGGGDGPANQTSPPIGEMDFEYSNLAAATATSVQHIGAPIATTYVISDVVVEDL